MSGATYASSTARPAWWAQPGHRSLQVPACVSKRAIRGCRRRRHEIGGNGKRESRRPQWAGISAHPGADGAPRIACGYDPNGNLVQVVNPDGTVITMSYDKENRESVHQDGSSVATYLYDGDGLKRVEYVDGARTTLIWDGPDYLQGRS